MQYETDQFSSSLQELRARGDRTIATSRELVAQLRILLEEHRRLRDGFVASHRSAAEREDFSMDDVR